MELLSIGAFARATGLTPKALRLYDESGLLPPAAVDPDSGYRFYAAAQLPAARLIMRLRRIGMPLVDIARVHHLPPAQAAQAVAAFWQRVSTDNARRSRQVALLVDELHGRDDPMSTTITVAARTELGAGRPTNEDLAYASPTLLAVADGTRGPGGAAASATAVAALRDLELGDGPAIELLAQLAGRLDAADQSIRDEADQSATTLTAILWRGAQLALVHIGDTRAYLLRAGELTQLTQDHTWVQAQVAAGALRPDEAATHPQRALLARALGAGPRPVEADFAVRTALPGDRYLLCSDGLHAVVDPSAVHAALVAGAGPEETVARLVELAYAAGAPDNIACVVADLAP